MTYPLNLLTRKVGGRKFCPVAAKSATGTGTPEMYKRIGASNQRLFLRPCFRADVNNSLSMGLCGADFGQAGFLYASSSKPRIAPPYSDWNQNGGEFNPKYKASIMSNITILASTIRIIDGKYSLNDLHTAAGGAAKHQPNRFLRLEQTQELIAEIKSSYPDMGSEPVKTTNGGANKGTYVCKELVYAYAMWVSPKFNLAVIRAFDSLQASSSPALAAKTTVPRLAAPKTTIITTIEAGCAPVTRTVYGDVAVMPESTAVALLDEVSGAMQFMADAYNRLDAVRVAVAEASGVVFDADGSAKRRADAAREFLRNWGG